MAKEKRTAKKLKTILTVLLIASFWAATLSFFRIPAGAAWTDYEDVNEAERVIVNIEYYSNPGASGPEKTMASPTYCYTFHDGRTVGIHMGFITADDYSLGSPRHGTDENTIWAYCMEFDVNAYTYNDRYGYGPDNADGNRSWSRLSDEQKTGIMLAVLYGYPVSDSGASVADSFAATQAVIWEFQTGIRTSVTENTRNAVDYYYSYASYSGTVSLPEDYFYDMMSVCSGGITAYNNLIEKIYNHFRKPDFASTGIELDYNPGTGKYEKILTDSNGVLSTYNVSADNGVSVSVSGNTLTLVSDRYIEEANITLTKKPQSTTSQAFLVLTPTPDGQCMVIGQRQVPVTHALKTSTPTGSLSLLKVDADTGKPLAEAEFTLYDRTGRIISAKTTDKNGAAEFSELPYAEYYVLETGSPEGYIQSDKKFEFTVSKSNQKISETLKNNAVTYKLAFYKKGEVLSGFKPSETDAGPSLQTFTPVYKEQFLSGCVIGVYAAEDITTADGTGRYKKDELVDQVTTSEKGPVYTKELFEGKYYYKEITAPYGFLIEKKATKITVNQNAEYVLKNNRQKSSLSFKKQMILEDGTVYEPSGDENLFSHVSFGLFTAEEIAGLPADSLIETIHPDENGDCTITADIPCGYIYYIKELSTAPDFIQDEAQYGFLFEYSALDEASVSLVLNGGEPLINRHLPESEPMEETPVPEPEPVKDTPYPDTGDPVYEQAGFFIALLADSAMAAVIIAMRKNDLTNPI